jgi:hypothetical protein
MPSTAVDDMSNEFLSHTRDYAAFCDTAFGHFVYPKPESALTPHQAAAGRPDRLLLTLRLARQPAAGPSRRELLALPLIFLVDHQVSLTGARRYLVDCGGRGVCNYVSTRAWFACTTWPEWTALQNSREAQAISRRLVTRSDHRSGPLTAHRAQPCKLGLVTLDTHVRKKDTQDYAVVPAGPGHRAVRVRVFAQSTNLAKSYRYNLD